MFKKKRTPETPKPLPELALSRARFLGLDFAQAYYLLFGTSPSSNPKAVVSTLLSLPISKENLIYMLSQYTEQYRNQETLGVSLEGIDSDLLKESEIPNVIH